eukprot:3603634-Prymnesium_polylepis.2
MGRLVPRNQQRAVSEPQSRPNEKSQHQMQTTTGEYLPTRRKERERHEWERTSQRVVVVGVVAPAVFMRQFSRNRDALASCFAGRPGNRPAPRAETRTQPSRMGAHRPSA